MPFSRTHSSCNGDCQFQDMETKRVYIGGLYHEATEKDLNQLFSKFGDVESVEIKKRTENDAVSFVFAYVNVKATGISITKCEYL